MGKMTPVSIWCQTLMVLVPSLFVCFSDTLFCFTFYLRLTSDEVFHLKNEYSLIIWQKGKIKSPKLKILHQSYPGRHLLSLQKLLLRSSFQPTFENRLRHWRHQRHSDPLPEVVGFICKANSPSGKAQLLIEKTSVNRWNYQDNSCLNTLVIHGL